MREEKAPQNVQRRMAALKGGRGDGRGGDV